VSSRRRSFLIGCAGSAIALATPVSALADESLDALLADIAKARKPLRTLKASFTQERKLTLLATSVKSTGNLSFVAPDRLRWELDPPDNVIYWIGPEGLSYRTKSSTATAAPKGAAIANALADVRALLGGDLGALKERYVLAGTRRVDDAEITGTAKDPKASVKSFVLVLSKDLTLAVRARLVEGKSDTIDITFTNAQINVPVDPTTMKP
jgi:outer membrane lipoprotein-sorting protein